MPRALRKVAFSRDAEASRAKLEAAGDRHLQVLRAVVQAFIGYGQPVGSKTIAEGEGCHVSPATIRGIMAELEQLGYLEQPHTSAGRVPTEEGFRAYADLILRDWRVGIFAGDGPGLPQEILSRADGMTDFLRATSRALSDLSGCVGLVLRPRLATSQFRAAKFVRLTCGKIVAVIVSDSMVADRVFRLEEDYSQQGADRIANYLGNRYSGLSLVEVQRAVQAELGEARQQADAVMRRILDLALSSLDRCLATDEIYLDGAAQCLETIDFEDIDRARRLLRLYEQKDRVARLLARCLEHDGIQIRIGADERYGVEGLEGLAVVAAQFGDGLSSRGSVGIIGPMRMPYAKVISIVEHVASDVGTALRGEFAALSQPAGERSTH